MTSLGIRDLTNPTERSREIGNTAKWADGMDFYAPRPGVRRGNEIIVEFVTRTTGGGTTGRETGEAFDGQTACVTSVEMYMPTPTPEKDVATCVAEIDSQLAGLDTAVVQALRAMATGTDVQDDHDKIADIDGHVVALRTERARPA